VSVCLRVLTVCVCSCARRMGRTVAMDLRQRICESCET